MTGDEYNAISTWLARQPAGDLAALLERLVLGDHRARRLVLMRMSADGPTPDTVRLHALVEEAIVPHVLVRHASEYAYGRGVDDVVDVLRGLLERGYAAAARDLCTDAMACCERAFEFVDEGFELAEAHEALVRLHLAACRAAPPAREALAAWFQRASRSDYIGTVAAARAEYEAILRR